MTRIIFFFMMGWLLVIGGCQNGSEGPEGTVQSFEKWLALADGLDIAPDQKLFAREALSAEEAAKAAELIYGFVSNEMKEKYLEQWQAEKLQWGEYDLKFKYKKFGEKPPQGWSLFISMHGGGGAPPEVNDQQWQNQIGLYEPAEGIYMAPRAPTNTWNLWHQPHVDELFGLFIQLAAVFENINTNRVYLTGYSAGGDGTYQLAPRIADWFAAAAMMAGHPNDASPLGLRNLPFAIQMGAEDVAYNRNTIAAEWGRKLEQLQQNDQEGYIHDVQIHEGLGHWMERRDTVAIDWMAQFTRQPYPEKVVWKQSSTTHTRFYWLGVPEEETQKDAEVIASRQGQNISVEKAEKVNRLIILLNDDMVDLDEEVTVEYNGEVVYSDVPQRTISTIWESLSERNDPEQVFFAKIEVPLN